MRICLVSQEFPPHTNWGGVGIQFYDFARILSGAGHRVVVISRATAEAPEHEMMDPGFEVWRVGAPLRRKRAVGRTLDRMLHARSVAARLAALDAVERFDVIEAPEAGLDGEALIRDERFAKRLVISCHGSNRRGQGVKGPLAYLHRLDWRWSARREAATLRAAHTIIVNSEATRREVLAGGGVSPEKIHLAYLGIDTEKFHPDPIAHRSAPLQVGFIGRLQKDKGIDFVWKVMQALGPRAGIQFHFKGAIHPANRTETMAQLEQFREFASYHQPGTHDDMPEFFRSLDVLFLPSRFESFGLAYAEAMATEVVVLAGIAGAGPEVVTDCVTGFLVDPDGPVSAAVEALRKVADDRLLAERIGRAARMEVTRRFSVERFAQEKCSIYSGVASQSTSLRAAGGGGSSARA